MKGVQHQKSATWKQKCKYEKNVTKINMKKVKVEKSAAQRKHVKETVKNKASAIRKKWCMERVQHEERKMESWKIFKGLPLKFAVLLKISLLFNSFCCLFCF